MYWRETAARPSSHLPTRGVSATLACVMLQWVKRPWARAVQIQLLWPGNSETCFHFWTLGWELGPGVGLGASVSLPAQAASVHLTTAGKPRLWASFHMKHPIKYIFLMSCGLWDHRGSTTGSTLTGHVPPADTRVPEARSCLHPVTLAASHLFQSLIIERSCRDLEILLMFPGNVWPLMRFKKKRLDN